MRHFSNYYKLLLIAFFSQFKSVSAQNIDDIIDSHITAMGGENYKNINSIRMIVSVDGREDTFTFLRGVGIKFEASHEGIKSIICVHKNSGWLVDRVGRTTPENLQEYQVKLISQIFDPTKLHNYKSKGLIIEYLGEDSLSSEPVHVLKSISSIGIEETLFISKKTFYIVKEITKQPKERGAADAVNEYSDFKKVNGAVFPTTSHTTYGINRSKNIEVNIPTDENIFEKPMY